MIYRIFLALKHFFYDKGWKKSSRADVPTLCVGNISVGGTGKTPMTELILRTLLGSDEWAYANIAVLSRGYKRRSRGFQKVPREGTARAYGDEPVQIARKFPSVTVAVDKDRVEGCRFLSHPEELQTAKKARRCVDKDLPPAEIIVLDDAFQYRPMKASLNIVLVDYNRPVHKDRLLPWGRLRDLPSRLKDADILVVTKSPRYMDEWEKGRWASALGLSGYNAATCRGRNRGKEQTLLFATMDYEDMQPVFPEADSRFIYAPRLMMLTGIAKDTPLRQFLSDKYKIVKRFSFPDHHRFSAGDMRKLRGAIRENPTACVATTEKDAQRLREVKKVPQALPERLFQVPVRISFLTEGEQAAFEAALLGNLHRA